MAQSNRFKNALDRLGRSLNRDRILEPTVNEIVGNKKLPVTKVSEMVGTTRPITYRVRNTTPFTPNMDYGKTNYAFWDKARHGLIPDMELSGTLLKPLSSKITSYVLGRIPRFVMQDEYTTQYVSKWIKANWGKIQKTYQEARMLGDSYIVVNADRSITPLAPDSVFPIVSDIDYSLIVGWQVDLTYPHPTDPLRAMTISDEFYTNSRRRTRTPFDGKPKQEDIYPNLIRTLPLVHISANNTANELYGRPDGQALRPLLYRYDLVLAAALEGNIRQGRPTPTIQKLGDAGDIQTFLEMHGKQRAGSSGVEGWDLPEWDGDNVMVLGGNAEFSYESPGLFAQDTEKILGILFYLLVQHSEVPEYAWGTAISSSKASAETQIDTLSRYIERLQNEAEDWLLALIDIVIRYAALSDTKIVIEDDVRVEWRPVTDKDGHLILNALEIGADLGVLDQQTIIDQLPLGLRDTPSILRRAKSEREDSILQAELNIASRTLNSRRTVNIPDTLDDSEA